MLEFKSHLTRLESGVLFAFRDWPEPSVPSVAAGVYTAWNTEGRLIYVGMSGRGFDAEGIRRRKRAASGKAGLYTRLRSHASGRRGGDQFCLLICDRFVLRKLSEDQIGEAAVGSIECLHVTIEQGLVDLKRAVERILGDRNGNLRVYQQIIGLERCHAPTRNT